MCLLCLSVGRERERETLPWTERRGGKSPEKRHSNCGPYGARDVQPMHYLLFALSNKANRVFE